MSHDIEPQALREALVQRRHVVVVDSREEGDHACAPHLIQSISIPLSRMELLAPDLVPAARACIVMASDDPGLDRRSAARWREAGYGRVRCLRGGIAAWEALGYPLYTGFNTYSKAFGEFVEHGLDTPSIEAPALAERLSRGERILILDSRTEAEHHKGTIPGSISMPGAELALRAPMLIEDGDMLVVVNCAGRTRSIIGTQSLLDAGISNPLRALRNGTMGWKLSGHALQEGSTALAPACVTPAAAAAARTRAEDVMRRHGLRRISWREWRSLRAFPDDRNAYLFDVRTEAEYLQAHPEGALHAAGGQLVQATDRYVASLASHVVLYDDHLLRAAMTASWLRRMGAEHVCMLDPADGAIPMAGGRPRLDLSRWVREPEVPALTPAQLHARLGEVRLIDLDPRRQHEAACIPGAVWTVRARLADTLARMGRAEQPIVLTGGDRLAYLAYADLLAAGQPPLGVLAGGKEAWVAAGLPLSPGPQAGLCEARDEFIKPLEEKNQQASMRQYLAWEIGLIDRVRADPTVHFHLAHPRRE